MRQAYTDTGWFSFNVTDPEKDKFPPMQEVSGLSLGFDFCAEHEWGIPFLIENFGIGDGLAKIGLPARTMTKVPESLGFFTFTRTEKSSGKTRRVPYAVLYCTKIWDASFPHDTPLKKAEYLGLRFYRNLSDLNPEKAAVSDFMQVLWDSREGFAVAVRGAEHVEKLTELHSAILAKDIVISAPSSLGFMRRGPALLQLSKVPAAVAQKCLDDDIAQEKLYAAANATGIEQRLKAANLRWYALSPAWNPNDSEPSVWFYLNPHEQRKNAGGWFTVAELDAWIQGNGPVVDGHSVEAHLKESFKGFDWHLSRGLNAFGVSEGSHLKYVWLDALKTKPGIVLTIREPGQTSLKSGTYPLEEMLPYYEEGLRQEALKNAKQEQVAVA